MADRTPSVVVVTWNAAHLLPRVLESLFAQRPSVPEIVVVDNGSTDDTVAEVQRDFPDAVLVRLPSNTGFTGGANAGIAAASGDPVILLNNDAIADPEFVAHMAMALEEHPGVGAVTGLILLDGGYAPGPSPDGRDLVGFDGTHWHPDVDGAVLVNSTGGEVTRSANGRDRDWLVPLATFARASGPAPAFSGGAVALRRSALPERGPFDESLFMYYEDSDLSFRLRRIGWDIRFERGAIVHHLHAASSGTGTEFFLFHNERNRLLFALAHAPVGVVVTAFARTIVGAARAFVQGRTPEARRKARALRGALAGARQALGRRRSLDRIAARSRAEVWAGSPKD